MNCTQAQFEDCCSESGSRRLIDPRLQQSDLVLNPLVLSRSRATCLASNECRKLRVDGFETRPRKLAGASAAAGAAAVTFGSSLGRLCAVCWRPRRELASYELASVSLRG